MATSTAKANHITNIRSIYEKILDADTALKALLDEATDNGYTFADGDFTGTNAGITASDYDTALVQATNWHNALSAGGTLPSGIRALFNKVAK